MGLLKGNNIILLLILAVVFAIFSWAGLAIFGVAIVSTAILGAMIGMFIPAILVLVGFLVLIGIVPTPGWQARLGISLVIFVLAWFISSLPGGGL